MIPDWLQAVVLGVVQGLTEFLPVSSSGHLVLVPALLGWERHGLAFDVALHLGTGAAIILYFRTELAAIVTGFLRGGSSPQARLSRRLGLLIVVGSVPVAAVGLLLEDTVAGAFETPSAAAGFLFVTAALLVTGERLRARRVRRWRNRVPAGERPPARARTPAPAPGGYDVGVDDRDPAGLTLDRIGLREALLVGMGQALALLPGVSRSGTTITAGVATGLTRQAATRFSFLLALPAILGAGLLSLPDLAEPGHFSGGAVAAGVFAAFVAGYLAIALLVRLVARVGLGVFAVYLVVAGTLGLVVTAGA